MASGCSFEEDLSCPVCCDIFKDPVLMPCGHSFCKICLQKSWKEKKYRECPMCRGKCSKIEPAPNLNLRSLCETFLKPQLDGPNPSKRCKTSPETLCHLHCEKLKLFCLDDDQPICVVCRDSRNHKSHNCKPVDEMAQDLKVELKIALRPIQQKLDIYNNVKQGLDQRVEHIKSQVLSTERQVNREFEKLRLFLREEEDARIAALRVEEEQKCQGMKAKITEICGKITLLANTIGTIEEEMRAEDVVFVKNYKVIMASTQVPLTDPPLASGPLVDVAKHLDNVAFRVWEKMRGVVKYVSVSPEPSTANPCLPLFDDLTGAMLSQEMEPLSDNTWSFDYLEWILNPEEVV